LTAYRDFELARKVCMHALSSLRLAAGCASKICSGGVVPTRSCATPFPSRSELERRYIPNRLITAEMLWKTQVEEKDWMLFPSLGQTVLNSNSRDETWEDVATKPGVGRTDLS
jgi:hypothetical protein